MPTFDEIHSQLKTIAQDGQHTLLSPTLDGQLILQLGKHSGAHLIKVRPFTEDELLCKVYEPKENPSLNNWEVLHHGDFIEQLQAFIAEQSSPEADSPTN